MPGELTEFQRYLLSELDRMSRLFIAQEDKIVGIREQQASVRQENEHCEENRKDHEARLRKIEIALAEWVGSKIAILSIITIMISVVSTGIALITLWKK